MAIYFEGHEITGIYLENEEIEKVVLGTDTEPVIVYENVRMRVESIPYETSTVRSSNYYTDYREITTPGVPGSKEVYYKSDGTIVKEVIVKQPVTEITTIGTKPIDTYETVYERREYSLPSQTRYQNPEQHLMDSWTCQWGSGETPDGKALVLRPGESKVYAGKPDIYYCEIKKHYRKGVKVDETVKQLWQVENGKQPVEFVCKKN